MDIIEQHRKTARRLSRENGTSHQSELNAIAASNGHANWGSYLNSLGSGQSRTGMMEITDLPAGRRELEAYAKELSHTIMPLHPALRDTDYEKREHGSLTGLILVEISRAREEGRNPSIAVLRGWLTGSLEEAEERNEEERVRAAEEQRFHVGDSHREFFRNLARKVNASQPYGRAYAEMTRMASMAPNERFQILMEIIPALSDHIDDELEKAA